MEIVIENPVESPPPPPPPPPPPLQSLTMSSPSAWNPIVATPPTTFSPSTVPSTSMPAATTVMTITIAENPTASPTYPPPVRFSYRETYAANSLSFAADPFSVRHGQPRGRSYGDPDGASPLLRRTDKSGLLGITESETSGLRTGLRSPRFLSGVNAVTSGILSPRRVECIGQLDPVLEVPGQPTRANVAPGAPSVFPVAPSANVSVASASSTLGQDRGEESRHDTCEALSVANAGRPMKSASFDSLETRHRSVDRVDVATTLQQPSDRDMDGIESSNIDAASYAAPFRLEENCEARTRTMGRLSRLALSRKGHDQAIESLARYSQTCCNFPFSVRPATVFPGFERTSSLPSTVTTSTTTVAASTMRVIDATGKEEGIEDASDQAPEGERAEAEGCEHGSSRNLMKNGESSQRSEEFVDNDGIQTLRVIILSEQL